MPAMGNVIKRGRGWRVRLGVNASSYHTVLCMHLLLLLEYITVKEMRILLCFVLMCCMSGLASAQMTAAKKNTACYREKDCVESICSKVWDYISETGKLQEVFGREGIYLRGEGFEC